MPYEVSYMPEKCLHCSACTEIVACPGRAEQICIGCGACVLACPGEARKLVEVKRAREVLIQVDGKLQSVPERISVKEALELVGYKIGTHLPRVDEFYAPCGVGACWDCAVEIDGEVKPSCITPLKEGMKIKTRLPEEWVPLRIVGSIMAHPAGGVGTPWEVKRHPKPFYLEAACLVAGCNLRCPQCQNWSTTYRGKGETFTPTRAASRLDTVRKAARLNRFLISGGECTLNRRWLVQLLKELSKLAPQALLHISTNGSLLTEDYIDELVCAGLTDIGIDLKGLKIDTFMRITGLADREAAQRCKENAWNAVKYISQHHREKVFLGVGIPYNKELISAEEVHSIGRELYNIDPSIQTSVVGYIAEFRSRIPPPSLEEIKTMHRILKEAGLSQTIGCCPNVGFFGPADDFVNR